jgi:hypothetical protein
VGTTEDDDRGGGLAEVGTDGLAVDVVVVVVVEVVVGLRFLAASRSIILVMMRERKATRRRKNTFSLVTGLQRSGRGREE